MLEIADFAWCLPHSYAPRASAMATSANTTLHLPSVAVPDACGDLEADLVLAIILGIAEIDGNQAIFVSC